MGKKATEAHIEDQKRIQGQFDDQMNNIKGSMDIKKQQLQNALDSRPAITNPYTSMRNEFANLGVATKAAEIQMEQSDIALANTLDALQASGASAGGATALAQAALKSKQGVAANIEQQEAQNEKLRLQGEQQLQQTKMSEALRVQGALMGEAARMQQVDVSGKQFVYSEQERRETEQLNRKQAQITGQQQAEIAGRQNQAAAISSGVSALGSMAGAAAGAYTG